MPELTTIDDYVGSPIGKATASRQLLCWFPDSSLRCIAVWGCPSMEDIELLLAALQPELRQRERYSSWVDLRGVTHVDPAAFERFMGFMRKHRAQFAANVRASAVVHAGGVVASAIAGYSRVLADPFPVSMHAVPIRAGEALGRDDAQLIARQLSELVARVRERFTVPERVRSWMEENLPGASVDACAAALDVSTRSLQRQLQAAGTSFRDELERARIDRAMDLLRATDDKVLAVALAVGFAKVQNFAAAFRRRTGCSPTEWRQRVTG